MKKLYCVSLSMVLMLNLFSQGEPTTENYNIGATYYDVQTIRSMQNRIFTFEDGSIGAVWNMGNNFPGFNDKGIGYNYYDGANWGSQPYFPITNQWATNPSYTNWGEIGEICVSQGENGLIVSTREIKGTGDWIETSGPGSNAKHPFVITTGLDNTIIHLLYLIPDQNFNSTNAQPIRGFIYYARSTDGGNTWDINQVLDGLGQEHYLGFTIGSYAWAIPKNDVIAFIAGDYLTDLVLMKSENGGENWQKTIVWEHPHPMFEIFTVDVDSFYCNDGGIALALDAENSAHVTFGLSRVFSSTQQNTSWFDPKIGGLVYWKEGMETFSNNVNALNPYNHPDSELEEDVNLIASIQGFETVIAFPAPGMITMPQISIHETGIVCVVYSSVTELFNPGEVEFRHLWGRIGNLNGNWGEHDWVTNDISMTFDEVVYPSLSNNFEVNQINLICQKDLDPGLNPTPNQIYNQNFICHIVYEFDNPSFQEEILNERNISVNPIPASETLNISGLSENTVSIKLIDILGNTVIDRQIYNTTKGVNINVTPFQQGIYFLQIESADSRIVKKIIIGE